ncbi:hypothetical protein ACLOJK_030361 [Asimina triloba]
MRYGGNMFPLVSVFSIHPDIKDEIPFLALNKEKKIVLCPLLFLHPEAPSSGSFSGTNMPCASAEVECPLNKWVHVGCEVAATFVRLYIDGVMVREKTLSQSSENDSYQDDIKRITLAGNDGTDGKVQGYVHYLQLLPQSSSIADHFVKNPPLELSLDTSCISEKHEVEEGDDGVWSVVGGKLVASLVYYDNGASVEKSKDEAEAPLLTSYDGVELPSTDRPIKLLHGRASFKLKISQLSAADEGSPELQNHSKDGHFQIFSQRMSKYSPPPKRVKVGSEKSSVRIYANTVPEHLENVYGSHCLTAKEDGNAFQAGIDGKPGNLERTGSIPSDSESVHIRNSDFRRMEDTRKLISDMFIFKYCLGSIEERSLLLREIVATASDQDTVDFAHQVSLYTGCYHHRHQILAAKALVQEGIDTWNSITWNSMAQSNVQVLWKIAVQEIDKKFMKISHCSSRGLSVQDMELLQRVAGCQEMITRENFDKMWCWLYPVAITLSREHINAIWESTSPKWIEGLITKEEAEASLTGPIGLQRPGTFILRFPTSRSWPHPDAGNLIVTYVGTDYSIHHKMLSLDDREANTRPLQDLLMAEPELSQLGRSAKLTYKTLLGSSLKLGWQIELQLEI